MIFFTPEEGDQKIVRKFLWYPETFSGVTRWLEYASIVYQYQDRCSRPGHYFWAPKNWGDWAKIDDRAAQRRIKLGQPPL